jgi:cobalt/nickel transport system permease protein
MPPSGLSPNLPTADRPTPDRPRRAAGGFAERTIAGLSESLERDLVAEELANRDGWLQRLDPRTKVLVAGLAVLVAGLLHHLPLIAALYAVILGIGLAARLPADLIVRRVWIALPLFTAVVAVPAVFSFVTPGPALLPLGRIAGGDVAITAPGVRTALTLLMRVAASVSAVLLLVLSTRWPTLLKALRVLRLPQSFVLIFAMTYRYIFLLAHTANSMFLARKSRTVGPTDGAGGRRFLAATTSTLLGKSYHLSNEVYLAMIARGFRGEPTSLDTFRLRPADFAALAATLLAAAAFLLADRFYAGPW